MTYFRRSTTATILLHTSVCGTMFNGATLPIKYSTTLPVKYGATQPV